MAILFKPLSTPPPDCEILPPPSTVCPDPLPCVPDKKVCDPIVPIRAYMQIKPGETERCFKMQQGGCGAIQTAEAGCVEFRVRKRGCCQELSAEKPYRINQDCSVCFKWSAAFLALDEGYYEADVYIIGKKCTTIGMYLPPCAMHFTTTHTFPNETCAEVAACCALPKDEPPVIPPVEVPECGGCS